MIARDAVVNEARTWIGTRWQHQASLKGVACDCIGLVIGVARALGLPAAATFDATPAMRAYTRQPDPELLLRSCDLLAQQIPIEQAQPGDVLVMRYKGGEPQHFGIMSRLDPPYMIHALAMIRRVAEHRIDAVWQSRIMRAYRLPGVE